MSSGDTFNWRRFSAPRYWPTWSGIGIFWLLAQLPFGAQLATGRLLGTLLYYLLPRRRRVSLINLALAFPERSASEHRRIARKAFAHAGMAISETACAWFCPLERYADRIELQNPWYLDEAVARGKGVLLLQAHFTTIDLPSGVMNARWPIAAVYDDPKNPLYAAWITHRRLDYMQDMIDNRDMRSLVRHLRRGGIVWYSPDQTVKRSRGGIDTHYFDQPVLTSSGTARIVAMTGAAVVPFQPIRHADSGRYTLKFSPTLELDTRDARAATDRVNQLFESQVRAVPEQYFWVHQRFRPPDPALPDPYAR